MRLRACARVPTAPGPLRRCYVAVTPLGAPPLDSEVRCLTFAPPGLFWGRDVPAAGRNPGAHAQGPPSHLPAGPQRRRTSQHWAKGGAKNLGFGILILTSLTPVHWSPIWGR